MTVVDTFTSPRGVPVQIEVREGTNDWNVANACLTQDEYHLKDLTLEGWALDVGAHLGAVSIGLAVDNPGLTVVAVEAVPANAELARANVERNGLAGRVIVLNAAASSGAGHVLIRFDFVGDENARIHRFIGDQAMEPGTTYTTTEIPAVSLSELDAEFGPFGFLKIDCEGCEWSFLDDQAVGRVAVIRGEWHPRDGHGRERLIELLGPTHELKIEGDGFGPFEAVRL